MGKISVSVMCSDLMNLERDIRNLESLGVDYLHLDVMDGHFVPNLTFGPDFAKAMRRITRIPLDVHVMVTDPSFFFTKFDMSPGEMFTAHVETADTQDLKKLSEDVHSAGCRFLLAVNPETPVEALKPFIGCIDGTLLMLVHPGFAGAKIVDGIMEKVGTCRKFLDANGGREKIISVDGSVSCERAEAMKAMGASVFVGGTAGVYRKGMAPSETIPLFRKAVSD